jgi:hypothetical protein
LLFIAGGGALLGLSYGVQNLQLPIVYALAFFGPIVAVPTTILSAAAATRSTPARSLSTAFLGACLGLACGFLIVVFGLGTW